MFISQSEKSHRIQPLKMDTLRVSVSMLLFTYMTNQNITSFTNLYRGDIALHSAYNIDYH